MANKKKELTASEIGRLGGLSKSEAKKRASRLNGLLGGKKKTGVKGEKKERDRNTKI